MVSSPVHDGRRAPATELDGERVDGVAPGIANPTVATAGLGSGSNGGERRPEVVKAAEAGGFLSCHYTNNFLRSFINSILAWEKNFSSKKKKMAVVAIKEAPSLFAPLCLMAEGSSKVLYEELKTSRERLTISHEKLKEAHDNLLSTTQHGAHIDVGISCDLLDDSASCHIPHVASSSISTSCDDLIYMPSSSSSSCVSICDASLVVENNELKEQVVKLNKSLERCFKGKEYS
uniref:Uncharacterized protein n=1 Tax=Oryza sativa subsp. japonica TaxID=39947 RepID=Q53RM9_ORYSJ|nr:hypothetical protein [Oryza sativa Japonica Group]